MKKGLLSLLAAALTIVSCQNYDDQFAELTGLVNTLSTEVAGLSTVSASVQTLSNTVNGLVTSVSALPTTDNSSSIAALTTALETAQTEITAITGSLLDVSSASDLQDAIDALAAVQADVDTLLEADAVINQNIRVNNSATLDYANSLINTGADDPNVIVNGSVILDTTSFTTTITTEQLAEVNAIAAKLATVLGDASGLGVEAVSATALDFSNLVFIDADYIVDGADMSDANLRTVTGELDANHGAIAGAFDYSQLVTVGDDFTISTTTAASATSINLSGVVINGDLSSGGAPGVLAFPSATTIDLGTASFIGLTANKATSIESGQTGAIASLTIVATNGGTINMNAALSSAGAVVITAATTSTIHIDGLTSATTVTCNSAGQMHFPGLVTAGNSVLTATAAVNLSGLTSTGGTLGVSAPTVLLTSLASITFATDLNAVSTLDASALVSVTALLTIDNGPINLPNAQFAGAGALAPTTTATTVTVGGSDDVDLANVTPASVDFLTLTDQGTAVTSTNATLRSLNATIDSAGSAIDLSITNVSALLTSLSTSGYDVVTVNTTAVVTMTTAGTTRNLVLIGNTALSSLTVGHVYDTKYTDAQLVEINDNDDLTSVDLTSVARLENADIQGNATLATITAPGITDLLTPGATVSFTIKANSLTGTYTNSVAAVADGINNSAYVQASVVQPSLATWNTYATAVSALNTMTLDIEYGGTSFTTATAADSARADEATTFTGTVDTLAELQAFVSN